MARFGAQLAVALMLGVPLAHAQTPGLLDFYDVASARAAAPADKATLAVVCAEKLQGDGVPPDFAGSWLSFLTTEGRRVQIAALTKAPMGRPAEVIALKPRFNPLPTARVGPAGTLDWAYVYDRNGDGRVDYLVYLNNAMAVLPDPLPPDFPKPELRPDGSLRVSMELFSAIVKNAQMVFRHYADDRFTGSVDGVVVEEYDPERPMFVRGHVAYLAARDERPEEAWAFRKSINERTRTLTRDANQGYRLPTTPAGQTEPASALVERGTRLLGLFNAALARCPGQTGPVERAAR